MLAADLDFKESFADPATRDTSLESLIPGTRDWFFDHALDHQLTGRVSWTRIARDGSDDEVLAHLQSTNLHSANLDLIRWRVRDRSFFIKSNTILRDRLNSSQQVTAYGFLHTDAPSIRPWLENAKVRTQVGGSLQSPLLTIDPVERFDWQSLEFDPLVNPRSHPFGDNPRLSFETARQHYENQLDRLSWKAELSSEEQLHLSWFLFLQDRIEEAIARFE